MLGFYDNFPVNIHKIDNFSTTFSNKKLQQRLIRVLHEMNLKTFSFEEIAYPSVPECTIIFEAGLADAKDFNYIDEEETKKVLDVLRKGTFSSMDLFCAVRYYKNTAEKKAPLKFDYYMLRVIFGKNTVEIRVFHERGPRYISPEDIVTFLVNMINETSKRKILKKTNLFRSV
jgi:hypothetical protein